MAIEKAEQILSSWSGHAGHGDSYSFIQKLIKNKSNNITHLMGEDKTSPIFKIKKKG